MKLPRTLRLDIVEVFNFHGIDKPDLRSDKELQWLFEMYVSTLNRNKLLYNYCFASMKKETADRILAINARLEEYYLLRD